MTGTDGMLTLFGVVGGRITPWEMRPAAGGVTITATGAFAAYWAKVCPETAVVTLTLPESGTEQCYAGRVAELTTTRITLVRTRLLHD